MTIDSRLRMAYATYLKNKRLSQNFQRSGLSVMVAEMTAVCADDYPAVSTALHVFYSSRSRLDPRSATIYAIAILLEKEFPPDMDALLLEFLLEKAGLADHPDRARIASLAERVGMASEWAAQVYIFSRGVLNLQRENEEEAV